MEQITIAAAQNSQFSHQNGQIDYFLKIIIFRQKFDF